MDIFKRFIAGSEHFIYTRALRPIFFKFDPESVHEFVVNGGSLIGDSKIVQFLCRVLVRYENPMLEQNILGIKFDNPVGVSAGFDKNATLTNILGPLGFGFEEVGSITGEKCDGNQKPRMWRLIKSRSIIVWLGLNNDGAEEISKRLKNVKFSLPVGLSFAKTNSKDCIDTESSINDYLKSYKLFSDIGSYVTINISCPNAFGGEPFSDSEKLEMLLRELSKLPKKKPIFIKFSPDMTIEQTDALLKVCDRYSVDGIISSNLRHVSEGELERPVDVANPLRVIPEEYKEKYRGKGNLSGKPVEHLSNRMISHIYREYGDRFVIIGTGGIFTAEDAYRKIRHGASLVQMVTGLVFEGPLVGAQINRGLVELLRRDGFKHISEARGIDAVLAK